MSQKERSRYHLLRLVMDGRITLKEALREEEARVVHREVLDKVRRRRFRYPADRNIPDSVELLREDRLR